MTTYFTLFLFVPFFIFLAFFCSDDEEEEDVDDEDDLSDEDDVDPEELQDDFEEYPPPGHPAHQGAGHPQTGYQQSQGKHLKNLINQTFGCIGLHTLQNPHDYSYCDRQISMQLGRFIVVVAGFLLLIIKFEEKKSKHP